MVYLLDSQIGFPDPREGDEDGLFAVGGDLSPERLLLAYQYGIFPWYAYRAEDACPDLINPENGEPYIQWWCPMQRFVIFPNEIHISHSMRQMIRQMGEGKYRVTFNRAFEQVITHCGALRDEKEGAWLGPDIKAAYMKLHEMQYAASVEVWQGEELIGGLYGVAMGNYFVGESMFSLRPSASKLALIMLAKYYEQNDGVLIDCQLETPHLRSMGGRFIPYDEYLKLIHS